MIVWRRAAGIAGSVMIGLMLWVSCNGGGEEGPEAVAAPCQNLEEFKRFRYTYTYKIESPKPEGPVDDTELGEPPFAVGPSAAPLIIEQQFEGSFVAPDRYFMEVSFLPEGNSQPVMLTYIGGQVWARSQETDWIPADVPNTFAPSTVCDAVLAQLDFTTLPSTPDSLDGLETRHFETTQEGLDVAGILFGPQSDMGRLAKDYSVAVWLTDDGWPARLEARSSGYYPSGRQMFVELTLEIRDVDAGDIEIEAPVEQP